MDRRRFLAAGLATGLAAGGAAALAPSIAFSAGAALASDIEIIRSALALHPGLYRYNSPAGIEARLARLAAQWPGASLETRFLALSEFLAAVRCGHTHCNPYNQSDEIVAALFERRTRVPFRFTWIDGRMIVLGDAAGALARGDEILRLNGERPRRLLKRLMAFARADGGNDAKRVALMEMRNTDAFETFDIFQGLIAPPDRGVHRLDVKTSAGERRKLEVAALDFAERRAERPTEEEEGKEGPLWTWTMRGDVALLTMPTWVMYNTKWDWKGWLDERLKSLAGAKGLVIDLRDNEGGNECGNVILARLAKSDLSFPGYEQRVRFRRTPAALDPYLDTWDRSFRTIGAEAEDIGGGFLRLPGLESTDIITAENPKITVPVAALVGPVCSSATFSFARRAKESKLVRLFGAQTGGNLRGINGGAYFFVRLPESGIEFDVPLIGYFPATPRPDRGVEPDVAITPTARDIANGADPCLDAAMGWCLAQ